MQMTAKGGGFFASASQFQLTHPEMYEIHGPQVWRLLKYAVVDFLTADSFKTIIIILRLLLLPQDGLNY